MCAQQFKNHIAFAFESIEREGEDIQQLQRLGRLGQLFLVLLEPLSMVSDGGRILKIGDDVAPCTELLGKDSYLDGHCNK